MKHKRILALVLALTFVTVPQLTASAEVYFPDVVAGAWYADSVNWATDSGIVKGYMDGTFGVGRECIWNEAVVMLWRAAGSKTVNGGTTEADKAWAWLERQSGRSTAFVKGDIPISRIDFAWVLYAALGDLTDIQCELPFVDIDFSAYDDFAEDYGMAMRWVYGKGVMSGHSEMQFCPDDTLTREQVVSVLKRCFDGNLKYAVTKKTVPFVPESDDGMSGLELVFLDGVTEVPYIGIDTLGQFLKMVCNSIGMEQFREGNYDLAVDASGDRVTFMRENGFPMIIDFDTDTISFMDFDAFVRVRSDGNIMDILTTSGFDAEGRPAYLQILDSTSERYGRALTLDLGAYGLRLVHQDGEYYIPLQTVSDLLLTPYCLPIAYNGEGIFITQPAGAAADEYYSVPTGDRSPALALFTYKELCFLLDTMYGLSEQHGIDSFAEEFMMIDGMQEALLGTDPAAADEAIARLASYYLDDLHSGFNCNSYLEGPTSDRTPTYGASVKSMIDSMVRVATARKKAYPNGVPGYEEVGDTAFITFDSFTIDGSVNYYETAPDATATDTMGLMLYSFAQIKRKGSPVKNVVLDLSNNTGGAVQAAAFVLGMFLGEGSISVQSTLTGALVTENFRSDMNLDRVFDDRDTLEGYNLYCMISPVSFSCGNLVPSFLKSSHKVTILGQTSGGGSCSVMKASTADGIFFQLSSPYCMSFLKNGSFYDIDQGVTPDVYIRDYANFCDRKVMVDIIHNLK